MKYFSPNILDGSVTTAKLANLAVTEAKLALNAVTRLRIDTSITSQGGTIAASGSVGIAMDPYTFFSDIEVEGALNTRIVPDPIAVPNANADQPVFVINNLTGVALLYDTEWRHVDA